MVMILNGWRCPVCGNTENREIDASSRPFCDECDETYNVARAMKAVGPASDQVDVDAYRPEGGYGRRWSKMSYGGEPDE